MKKGIFAIIPACNEEKHINKVVKEKIFSTIDQLEKNDISPDQIREGVKLTIEYFHVFDNIQDRDFCVLCVADILLKNNQIGILDELRILFDDSGYIQGRRNFGKFMHILKSRIYKQTSES